MSQAWAVFLASVVTTSGAILVAIMNRVRKENAKDHEVVQGVLRMVHRSQQRTEEKVDKVIDRLHLHIVEHHKDSQDS